MKLDILAFAAHPDDVELACSGTLIQLIEQGKKVGVIDLTQGELGTRGNRETRKKEAEEAAAFMQLAIRENLGFKDGFLMEDEAHLLKIIQKIRAYQPELIFCNAPSDRHPDHAIASGLVKRAAFLAGLPKIEDGQKAHRPRLVLQYIQDYYLQPSIVLDITPQMEKKLSVIQLFKTQFFDPNSAEPQTPISRADFIPFIEARARQMGRHIGTIFAEGFISDRPLGVSDVFKLM